MAVGQLRDSRGRESAAVHPLQSLSAPLPGAETGSCQCCIFWETHPLHFHGTPYETPGDEVTTFLSVCFLCLSCSFQCVHSLLVLQRKLQVSLLRYPRETRLSAQQAAGRHAVHGPETAARPAEAEVETPSGTPCPLQTLEDAFPSVFFRFKPVQKFDSCSGENYSGGGQTHPGAAEQTVIAQRQHHQQFLGPSESFRPHIPQHLF